jgi:hypothetical protein
MHIADLHLDADIILRIQGEKYGFLQQATKHRKKQGKLQEELLKMLPRPQIFK